MELLERSPELYLKMIEEIVDYAILLMDRDGKIINWNKGAENIKGYKSSEIIGKNFREFYLPADRANMVPEMLIETAIREGKASAEGYRVRKDGSTFYGSILITALHDVDNNVIGFTKVTRDLTERKKAEDRIRDYSKELENQNKELAQYAYITSHDLQEPLRKIQTFIDLSRESDDLVEVRKYLDKVDASAGRMSLLIKGILNYIKVTEGDGQVVAVNLNRIIGDVSQDFELLIEEKGATIECGDLPTIWGKEVQLYQLFSNLISNALKFNDGTPNIKIMVKPNSLGPISDNPSEGSGYITITITDNGIGFEPQYVEQVFGLFKRLNTAKEYSGTGLGLSLCRRIVESHNGKISALSTPGKGTQFEIVLPSSIVTT